MPILVYHTNHNRFGERLLKLASLNARDNLVEGGAISKIDSAVEFSFEILV